MQATCTKCSNIFLVNVVESEVNGGIMQSFSCPSCNEVYKVAFITTKGLGYRTEINMFRHVSNLSGRQRNKIDRLAKLLEREVRRPSEYVDVR